MKPFLLSFLFATVFSAFSFGNNCVSPPEGVDTTSVAYETVIANDPFCCSTQWDNVCQNAYENFGGPGGGSGECVTAPAEVDTESEAYATVIANDPFCCNTNWDGICQNAYNNLVGSDGGGDEEDGDCVSTPVTVDVNSEAYATVIANDPFCCTTNWDGICQNAYNNLIDNDGGDDEEEGDCVSPPVTVDVNSDAYNTVITNDPFCCNNLWDGICQSAYNNLINSDGDDEEEGECVTPPVTVDVNSEAYNTVIANDPFCCNNVWDGICQNAYNALINSDGDDEEDGECVSPPVTVDVNSEAYNTVIINDPFCCNNFWDGICQNAYNNLINNDGEDEDEGECVNPPVTVDTNSEAYATVIANDPFCCNVNWDGICQNAYNNLTNDGDCQAETPEGVDTNSDAYTTVIANDPFCCNNVWDGVCQNAYDNYSEGGIIVNPGGSVGGLLDSEFGFSLFPNPANDQITLNFESVNLDYPVFVRLYNGLGQIVIDKGNIQLEQMHQVQIDVSNLGSGFYMVVANNGDEMISKQLVKQ
jgi:hypothetical protein